MSDTSIEWTDKVWNPTTGCNKVSRGCKHCYAEVMHKRLTGMGTVGYERSFLYGASPNPTALPRPFKWKKPRRVFVNSMSDLFHPNIPFDYIDRVFITMASCPQHTFQILTKRPERMAEYLNSGRTMHQIWKEHYQCWPLSNVWLGTSVENQAVADERIPHLLNCPAAVRFLSCEPLLAELDLRLFEGAILEHKVKTLAATGKADIGIHWVIAGGESGHKAAPLHPDWVRGLRDQCQSAGVPFLFKQWGEWAPVDYLLPSEDRPTDKLIELVWVWMRKVGKKAAGRLLDGVEHNEFPETKQP